MDGITAAMRGHKTIAVGLDPGKTLGFVRNLGKLMGSVSCPSEPALSKYFLGDARVILSWMSCLGTFFSSWSLWPEPEASCAESLLYLQRKKEKKTLDRILTPVGWPP